MADVLLSVTPPPQMPATLEAGTILGYCVGEPWNQQAVFKGIGVPVITDYEIWKNNPEKVFGFTAEFQKKNPNTVLAATKALIRAGMWLDENNNANRMKAVKILAKSEYVGADANVIANSMTGTFEYEKGDKRSVPDFNVFFRYFATYPYYSDAVWYLTQMRRWGQISASQAGQLVRAGRQRRLPARLYLQAAKLLVAEGKAKKADFPWDSDGYRAPTAEFIDKRRIRRPQAQRLPQQARHRSEGRPARLRLESGRKLSARAGRSAAAARPTSAAPAPDRCKHQGSTHVLNERISASPASPHLTSDAARSEPARTLADPHLPQCPAFSTFSASAGSCR